LTAAYSFENPATTPATDWPVVPPESDHTGIWVEPLDIMTNEGLPVAIDMLFAARYLGAPIEVRSSACEFVIRVEIRAIGKRVACIDLNIILVDVLSEW
tara:strand:+ start:174 stop:470 length:297 start_codon:yes stop_codon:yes gene_type:complete